MLVVFEWETIITPVTIVLPGFPNISRSLERVRTMRFLLFFEKKEKFRCTALSSHVATVSSRCYCPTARGLFCSVCCRSRRQWRTRVRAHFVQLPDRMIPRYVYTTPLGASTICSNNLRLLFLFNGFSLFLSLFSSFIYSSMYIFFFNGYIFV